VVVVGGGATALEAVLALHGLAADDLVVTLIAPERELVLPRGPGRARAPEIALEDFMAELDWRFRRTALLEVDAERGTVRCATGPDEPYDALVVATGASAQPAFRDAVTFDPDDLLLDAVLDGLQPDSARSVAFVVPRASAWPLALYELILSAADAVWSRGLRGVRLHLVTPERAPLDMFGVEAGTAVAGLLRAAGIAVHRSDSPDVMRGGRVRLGPEEVLDVDRVVALPVPRGRRLGGLPSDARGFLPVDPHGRVSGVDAVYAAGSATDRPIGDGGLACQQADTVAAHVAAEAGVPVVALPYAPVLRGRLTVGHPARFARPARGRHTPPASAAPLWWPPAHVSARLLGPYLRTRGIVEPFPAHQVPDEGVDVGLPLRPLDRRGG
jgi:sulfide:quinone oxidoreductase